MSHCSHVSIAATRRLSGGSGSAVGGGLDAVVLVGVVGFARLYFGAHLPLDVVGGLGVGITCGAIVSVLVGTPVS